MKDALRRTNKRADLVRSDADGTQRLERLLLGELGLPIEQISIEDTVARPLDEIVVEPPPERAPPSQIHTTSQHHENKRPRKRRKKGALRATQHSSRNRRLPTRYEE